ncbi:hypothetical protein GCM10010909_00230 [Acidocella aquatica]|uniref:DUF3034 family protein n=1 Tax=Acidocella aquatica TaxID=1922313 RepID=A0ABQ6A5I1_9PROT|nr:DUF3034 family protein [Acidocella aquatica]GLR65345.1 hypothetical protein GCM10010909_00230 [Acidocella aquatica]
MKKPKDGLVPSPLASRPFLSASLILAASAIAPCAFAQIVAPEPAPNLQAHMFDMGGLVTTGAVTAIGGAAGGGIVPWALIGGYTTQDQVGGTAFYTHVFLRNYQLSTYGGLFALSNRVEVSFAHQDFALGGTGGTLDGKIIGALGLPASTPDSALPHALQLNNANINQDIIGIKVRLYGNAVYDQDTLIPEISMGYEYHRNENTSFVRAIGTRPTGNEYYLAATKVWLHGLFGHYTMVTGTLDVTNAIQNGLLGFGGVGPNGPKNGYHVEPEFAVGYWINNNLVIGGEYRFMPHYQVVAPGNVPGYGPLGNALSKTSDWKDVYIAYFPVKYLSVTLAYADLGTIASEKNQNGVYLSGTASF